MMNDREGYDNYLAQRDADRAYDEIQGANRERDQLYTTIEDLIGKLELALEYLEHPDVQVMNFALGTEVVAKRIRKSIARARGE